MIRALMLGAALLTLAGCTTMGKMADVAMNPDIQVGSNNDQPSTLGLSLVAEPDVNPNESGRQHLSSFRWCCWRKIPSCSRPTTTR